MKKIYVIIYTLWVATSVLAQTPQPPTPNYQAKLDSMLKSLSNITIPELKADSSYQAKGNLKRSYWFAEAGQQMPYRLYVPITYQSGKTPLMVLLHGGGGDENTLMERGEKIAMRLAEKHGYIVLSPMGYAKGGGYGSFLKLPAVFGKKEDTEKLRNSIDNDRKKVLQLSEKDVMNVLEIVRKEYNPDPNNIFLAGHSMGSGGTWYLGAKYWEIWKALAPMSGPFIDEVNYPFDKIKAKPIHISEGTLAEPSLESSRLLAKYLVKEGFNTQYMEVEANHSDMPSFVLPSVFEFFNKQLTLIRSQVAVNPPRLADTFQSFKILPDNTVQFRIKAPKATEVFFVGDHTATTDTLKMVKDAQGIWSLQIGPLRPDFYGYEFWVDGVRTIDPRNPLLRESSSNVSNLFFMPSHESDFLAEKNVPHGTLEKVYYHSNSLNLERRMHVYLPPNYDKIKGKLPVLYLLHGGSGNDATWHTIGRANFMLDNLYAEGKIPPMIVVMPNGHTPLPADWMWAGTEKDPACQDILQDIIPLIEKKYRVSSKREHRAIAGLSMGGVQVLNIALFNPEKFAYVAPMGTGYFPHIIKIMEEQKADVLKNPNLKSFKNFTFYMGKEDPVAYNNGKNSMALLAKNNINFNYIEEDGGHRQTVFRRNFYDFVQKIFK